MHPTEELRMRKAAAVDVREGRKGDDEEQSRRRAWAMQVADECCWTEFANWEGWQNPKG